MKVKNLLIVLGVVITIYVVYFLNVSILLYSGDAELLSQHWMGEDKMVWLFRLGFIVFALHLIITIWAVVKKHIVWSSAIPIYLLPYMLGAIIQSLIL